MSDKKIKVYLGWLSTGQREDAHLYLLRDLQQRYGEKIELVLPDLCVHRLFHDAARNAVVEEFLASDCDVLWFLDSDVVPPNHVLDLVAHHYDKWQCAGAPYPLFMPVPGTNELSITFTVYNGIDSRSDGRGIFMAAVPDEGQDMVDGLATGCLFIKREVFAQLSKPYFEFKYDHETRRITEGEDLGFALKCHDKGIKFFVDYGMVAKHMKKVCLLDMNNYAINMSNKKTLDYDRMIREDVEKALKASYEAGVKKGIQVAVDNAENRSPNVRTKAGLILPDTYSRT